MMKWKHSAPLLSFLFGCAVFAAPATNLTVGEGFVNPVGFHDPSPVFSWKLPAGVIRQSAYRIQLSNTKGTLWDCGWVESDQSVFVPYRGAPLSSREQIAWKVNFRDDKGRESGWSDSAHFELGLLSAVDWKAKWIRPSQQVDVKTEPVATLRRAFQITKPIAQARLYATARGVYELTLNGQRVGNEHFENGFTSYRKRVDTFTHDVTACLRTGDNTLSGLLGTGWYAGRFPFETKIVGPYGTDTALLVQLEITYADGSTETLVSDEKWEGTFEGPILSSSLYDGENYDALRQPANWAPVTAEADLGAAALTPKPFAPVRETQTVAVQQITQPQPGRYVFDLGQNMVGWARIKIPVEKNKTITVRFAEMLQADGTLYTANYRTAKSADTYTAARDGIIEWEPHFTFHGFRYVELSGLPENVNPEKNWVTGVVLRSDLPKTGKFQSSHAKLNQLQSNIIWGWWGNSLDIPTDCPQRDERMGWTGDAQVFCATSMFNTDAHAFWKSWLSSVRDDQYRDGGIPPTVPTALSKWESRIPGWMDAGTIIPWDVYVRTGDVEILAQNYKMMERLVAYYRSQTVNGLLPNIKGVGDWLQPYTKAQSVPGNRDADRKGDTPLPLLGLAFYAHSTQILANTARVLGRDDDAQRYGKEAAAIRENFTREYFDADGKLQNAPETQTAYALAIAFDLIPASMKPAAAQNLVRLVGEADGHLRTGFLGTPVLAPALDQTGHADVAANLLFKETYPSWFYSINQGATTMWERWNSYTRDKGFGDVRMNSFNHYAYGAIGQWMYERIAGLAPDPAKPGYKHFFVRPLIIDQLNSASAELETPYGKAASAWKKSADEKTVVMTITVPPNTTATIQFPDGRASQTVPAGVHKFECGMPIAKSNQPTADAKSTRRVSITEAGALADGATVNTAAIQTAIDRLASSGGGTIVVPSGVFVSGALDLKPGVNLHLEKGAVIRATTNPADFPNRSTRMEGQLLDYTPALINAEHCDGLRITGEGTLDGNGREIWDEFWAKRKAAANPGNFSNMFRARARLAFISNSRNVLVEGVTFKDSQFWNLHIYLSQNVTVRNARFLVPDDYKQAPSTDGVDVDSSQDVLIDGCYFSVTDDGVAMKGTKGPFALEDRNSPPVERVQIRNCIFKRAHAAVTLGSEATIVRDIAVENCRVLSPMSVLNFKLRSDTPQTYENIHYRGLTLEAEGGSLISVRPWKQYIDLKGQPPPRSVVRNITISDVTGRYGSLGAIQSNPQQTEIDGILLKNIDLTVRGDQLKTSNDVKNLRVENVTINSMPYPRAIAP